MSRAVRSEGGWIAHDGVGCPIQKQVAIEVVIRAGIRGVVLPQAIGWLWSEDTPHRGYDIIAYKPQDPQP